MRSRAHLLLALTAALAGCASTTMYRWGGYDDALYTHYKKPQEREAFVANLQAVILEAEKAGAKVPPGCYGEYGYALFEEGRNTEAVAYFQREHDEWPESRPLMQKMIRVAQRQNGKGSASKTPASVQGKAPAPEKR